MDDPQDQKPLTQPDLTKGYEPVSPTSQADETPTTPTSPGSIQGKPFETPTPPIEKGIKTASIQIPKSEPRLDPPQEFPKTPQVPDKNEAVTLKEEPLLKPPTSPQPPSQQDKPSPPPPPAASPPPPPPPPPPSVPSPLPSVSPSSEAPTVTPPKRGRGIKRLFFILAALISLAAIAFLVVRVIIPRIKSIGIPGLPGQEVAITYWGLWESASIVQPLIDEFEEEHPEINIEYVQQSHKEYRERLQSALARDEGPDIFRFHNTWVPMFRDELSSIPPEIYSSSEFQETFYPVAGNDLRVGANYVGIPLEVDGLALFYNQDIFNAAGKAPPTTWENLRKTAFELTIRDQRGKIQTAGVALGTTNNVDHWSDILALMMLQNGADLRNPTNKLAADALLFYTLAVRSDKVWDDTLPNSTQAFASGKVAMYFAPSWRINDIKALNSDLNFGVIPVPQLPNSSVTWASYWVEGVSVKSESQSQAWQFLKFLSQKESLEKIYAAALASGRPSGEPFSRVDMASLLKDDPLLAAYIEQAANARSWYLSSLTHDNGINDRIIKYFEDAVNTINQQKSPNAQKILETAAQGVNQVLSQYRI
jgi:multiple sugar transport system substrate-binding protein